MLASGSAAEAAVIDEQLKTDSMIPKQITVGTLWGKRLIQAEELLHSIESLIYNFLKILLKSLVLSHLSSQKKKKPKSC